MAQRFLHDLYVLSVRFEKSRKAVPERVPSYSLTDPNSFCGRTDVSSQQVLRPVRLLARRFGTGEHPILRLVKWASESRAEQTPPSIGGEISRWRFLLRSLRFVTSSLATQGTLRLRAGCRIGVAD